MMLIFFPMHLENCLACGNLCPVVLCIIDTKPLWRCYLTGLFFVCCIITELINSSLWISFLISCRLIYKSLILFSELLEQFSEGPIPLLYCKYFRWHFQSFRFHIKYTEPFWIELCYKWELFLFLYTQCNFCLRGCTYFLFLMNYFLFIYILNVASLLVTPCRILLPSPSPSPLRGSPPQISSHPGASSFYKIRHIFSYWG